MSSIRVADRYLLDREIGRGGSGAVWLARDEVLGRHVALKRIGLPPGASASELGRAEREARLAARIHHPNVIAVFDFVHEGDVHWLVTEYVEGTTLAQLVSQRGRLSPAEAGPVLLQTAEALAAAHRGGVVHRDVKPSNILIGADGTVKLSDFGIARGIADASLTQTGLVTGSPAYLAPEVATGASATPASDVWSFGTTIFHTLTGRPPYEANGEGGGVLAVLYRIAHEPPPRVEDPGWLGPLLDATMTPDPSGRPTMAHVVDYLRAGPQAQALPDLETQVLPTVPAPPRPPTAPRSAGPQISARTAAAAGAVVVLLLIAVVGAFLLGNDDDPSATPRNGSSTSSDGSDSGSTEPLPTVAELESFATTYVATASEDAEAGYAMLTSSYQARSPGYTEFWGSVKKVEILDISADPADLTVTYTYRYERKHEGKSEETVTLHLVQDAGGLLIDDAVSSG
ncbi:serine/threonine protein kinase [Nocardioides humilatus]|uniref:non-specific serine/threonine protein kinase n=1 Tax=Nocardioides humilatus TaxID=2607660 RepID=A0A5B1LAS0_9ACTN|nr:serine/threonine-protein kinase [Nocardioides humilatus]KAA1417833.1 serine/threonine protein kinase [Nocardioides humilatus]